MEDTLKTQALTGDADAVERLVQMFKGEKKRADAEKDRADQAEQRAQQAQQRAQNLAASCKQLIYLFKTDRKRYQQEMDVLFKKVQHIYSSKQEMTAELQQLRCDLISNAFKRRSLFAMPCSTQCRLQAESI